MVLRKASVGESLPPLTLPPLTGGDDSFAFREGDFVKISLDRELVRQLQTGHGEWVDSMTQVIHSLERPMISNSVPEEVR